MLPSHYFEGYAGGRPDPAQEWWLVREEIPALDGEWARLLGHLYEPWDRDGAESDGFGEENRCRREQAATLRLALFVGGTAEFLRWGSHPQPGEVEG